VAGGSFASGGAGTGSGLGSEGAIIRGERYIFAVNGGSGDISVLAVDGGGLHVVSNISSGGTQPISLTVHGDLLFVLNAGGAGNISGFKGAMSGVLSPLPGSTKPLSGLATQPAEVAFNPDGEVLVVTEKASNKIDTYKVRGNGEIDGPNVQNSAGDTPYGFAFSERGQLVVSEVEDKTPGGSTLSSYRLVHDGALKIISGKVPDGQTAACWVVITGDGKFAYTTNAATNDVSGYRLGSNGALTLFGDGGITATCDGAPIDMVLSHESDFLYVLNSGGRSISSFRVNGANGSLKFLGKTGGLPASVSGLAAD
jgi:6-phosphogluconolactonase (cycloisomerase 2 family)